MHRTVIGLMWLAVLGTIAASHGQKSRSHSALEAANYYVKAYELSPSEAATFSTEDGVPSPFWAAWDGVGVNLNRASIDGVSDYCWGDSAESVADGGLELRVAYSDSGIYILFVARDDVWSGYVSAIDYANDACELFGSKLPTSELYGANAAVNLPCLNGDGTATGFPQQLTFDYFQIQVRFGGIEPVQTIGFNNWNPLMKDVSKYGCWPNGGLITYPVTTTHSSVASQYGIKIDILPQVGLTRSQEWFFPWKSWGNYDSLPLTRRLKGDRVAMCFGYNDTDPTVQAQPTAMRWRNADPYMNTIDERKIESTIPLTSYDAWGDILFAERLDDAVGVTSWAAGHQLRSSTAAQIRWTGASLVVESKDFSRGDMIRVLDARGRVVVVREACSSSTLLWPAGLRGVFSVRVGERSAGTFVAR